MVLLLGLVSVAAAVPALSVWSRHVAEQDREEMLSAATEVALLLSSLSADDAAAQLDRLTALSAGGFRDEVTSRRAGVLGLLDDGEVTASAEVVASGVETDVVPRGLFDRSEETPRARILVATRATVRNAAGARDAERIWRWRLDVVMEDDRAAVASAEVAV